MDRRNFLFALAPLALAPGAIRSLPLLAAMEPTQDDRAVVPLKKAHKAWREDLSKSQYEVLFEEHTEVPGSSPLDHEKRAGTFVCAACHLPLFDAANKFDSGTGWPSFHTPIVGHIATKRDFKLVLPRTEYHCKRCGGHQGHVFNDGPRPTGKRYCNNGVALRFVPAGTALPALRG